METHLLCFIFLLTLINISCGARCYKYYSTSTKTCTGWGIWRRCKNRYSSRSKCCSGYAGSSCSQPMCRGGYSTNSCNMNNAGYVKYKDGTVVKNSGGVCYSPSRCINCNKGFYPTTSLGGYCKACPKPAYCNTPVCTSSSNSRCEYCKGEYIREKPGYNVYTGYPDDRNCKRACSWATGARCFPGTCVGDMILDRDCQCAIGFGGSDCATATSDKMPIIKDMTLMLYTSADKVLIVDKAHGRTFWTKESIASNISLTVSSHYKPDIDSSRRPNYILNYYIGIEEMKTYLTFSRGTQSGTWTETWGCLNFAENCDRKQSNITISSIYSWKNILTGQFKHMDKIRFEVTAKNGGKIYYQDRSSIRSYVTRFYLIRGNVKHETLEIQFDMYPPNHCFELSDNCARDALKATDFLKEPRVTVSWDGWTDQNSGIQKYELRTYYLHARTTDGPLFYKFQLPSKTIASYQYSSTLDLVEEGPYSVEICVYDRVGNYKIARRIILYDNASVVQLQGHKPRIGNATENGWINKYSNVIEVIWTGRFVNTRHNAGGWLNNVAEVDGVSRDLDDRNGRSKRTIARFDNIKGVVRFEIACMTEVHGISTYRNFLHVPEFYFHQEKMDYSEEFVDGKNVTFFIRGFDVFGKYAEDNVSVTIDTSPPIINNLWLRNGFLVNLSAHNTLDLTQMTIEWEALDYHSGIQEVSWKIFDNLTQTVHGQSQEPSQGEAETLSQCKRKYTLYAEGASCYCALYNGCFNKQFQIQPATSIGKHVGIDFGKDKGKHDNDYIVEISVKNFAGLTSILQKKITIDISPPLEGQVNDGISGDLEVDFQQSLKLAGHWGGFFDKESSVWFYTYGFSKRCLEEGELDIHSPRIWKVQWTYKRSATFTAPEYGKYYLTIMAYNHALGHSKPVCSDGVIIDTTPAIVSEVVIKDAVMSGGLIKSNVSDTVYMLHRNRILEEVRHPSTKCRDRATVLSEDAILLYPRKRRPDGEMGFVNFTATCNDLYGPKFGLFSYISSDTSIDLSWNVTNEAAHIHDFEVGLASEHSTFPDVMDFISSHHHQHIRLNNPNIFNGKLFFILIKAITKSSVTDMKIIGPFVYDLNKPEFVGRLSSSFERTRNGSFLTTSWDVNAFTDHGDPNALSYEVAIGTTRNDQDIMPFSSLSTGGSCTSLTPPSCTAVSINSLTWQIHGDQSYIVSVRARDIIGHFVTASGTYKHLTELASKGVVQDVDESSPKFVDIIDIDFQTSRSTLTTLWSGFEHPYEAIIFILCISNASSDEYMTCVQSNSTRRHTFSDLDLKPYETYYQHVIAKTEVGNVTEVSDGVTVVINGDEINGIQVLDGSNRDRDDRRRSFNDDWDEQDIDFQTSTHTLQFHWNIPEHKRHYLKDMYWVIEERASADGKWRLNTEYQPLKTTTTYYEKSGLMLSPGGTYRISIKFCARQYCFKPVHSDGVTVVPNPPTTGKITVTYIENTKQVKVQLDGFKDSDIQDSILSHKVIDHYEWALTSVLTYGRLLSKWQRITPMNLLSDTLLQFTIDLSETNMLTKCWTLAMRGYTKAGLSSTITSEEKNCLDESQIKPSTVIDVTGEPLYTENNHLGKAILPDETHILQYTDKDFTPYSNLLSAVWPSLRYSQYSWAVLLVTVQNQTAIYDRSMLIDFHDFCDRPDAIKCGETENKFINVEFLEGELSHGSRYSICIYGNQSNLQWKESPDLALNDTIECSDGITVDLTQPTAADVWIGNETKTCFQSSTYDLTVHWNSFIDEQESENTHNFGGIIHYEVALGTTEGAVDVKPFTNVGLTNHKTFHGLSLQNEYSYFATVKAYDLSGQYSNSTSQRMTIDNTPPQVTQSRIRLPSRHVTSINFVEACWTGVFVDEESGISHYSWAVGTHAGYDDKSPFKDTEEECANSQQNTTMSLKEGHAYFVTVTAHNRAGLYAMTSSMAFTVEMTPPIPGKVCDGAKKLGSFCNDLDYVNEYTNLHAHWNGFHDPHSTLVEYFVNIGSCAACENVLAKQPVGLQNEIDLVHLQLLEGVQYYVTVTACNTANLCSSGTSDGVVVDTTRPFKGKVSDGHLDMDLQYQASRNYLGCKWGNFIDPQSGISNYVWRVGTTKGGDDILPATDVHSFENAFIFDLHAEYKILLPKGNRIYCTVRAYNKAGMFSEGSSNGFIVDDSPPVFLRTLELFPLGAIRNGTTVLRTGLKVYWDVTDEESFIESQHLSISSHIGGDFNLSSIRIEGVERDYTFTDLDLHDGSYYDINLISCNGAHLCTESVLEDIVVDSSGPSKGHFTRNNVHAAVLNQQSGNWMTWNTSSLNLAWLGFEDIHSDIHAYTVKIGSQYMDNDLNEEPFTPTTVNHIANVSRYEEGYVQTFRFETQTLTEGMTVFISVKAENGVGLSSEAVHAQFSLISGGLMEEVRICDSFSCIGHCICAPNGQVCPSKEKCKNISGKDKNVTKIVVEDFIDLQFPDNIFRPTHSPVNTMLGAKWYIQSVGESRPLWYEWAVGESDKDIPLDIFDTVTEKVWHDVGQDMSCVFTLDRGKGVLEDHKAYSVFVRVWYSSDEFAISRSPGVTIDSHPSISLNIKGNDVKEITNESTKDVDFITRKAQIFADWSDRFRGDISIFHLYISTYPGGRHMHTYFKTLDSHVTSFNITDFDYEEDTRYYSIVQAFNLAGFHTVAISDGFMLDLEPPTPGIVFDGPALSDKHATANASLIQTSWHGFTDICSGINTYEYCVSSDVTEEPCDIKPLSEVGRDTSFVFYPKTQFQQGSVIKGIVRAVDFVGHVSPLISSNGVIIDTTPPVKAESVEFLSNVMLDSSFENLRPIDSAFTTCDNISNTAWTWSSKSCIHLKETSRSQHGRLVLHLQGSIVQTVKTTLHGKYRLTFYTSTIPSDALQLSAIEGYTQINGKRHVFMLYDKPNTDSYTWQKQEFFFVLNTNLTDVEIGTAAIHVAFAIDDIQLQLFEVSDALSEETRGHININTVYVHDWSALHVDWSFMDPETEIVEYIWAIGTKKGGTQIQPFVNVGMRTFASKNNLKLRHNTVVYVTVVAVNAAGLRTVSHSDAFLVDLTSPVCTYITDGPVPGHDIDLIGGYKLEFYWNIFDLESGLRECSWALGTFERDTSIQEFVKIQPEHQNVSKLFFSIQQQSVYITVRCTNGAGLTRTCSSDGIKLIQTPPSIDKVILEILTTSQTQYRPRGNYHGDKSKIQFRWNGFKSEDGVKRVLVTLEGKEEIASKFVESSSTGYSFESFKELNLEDGEYTISIIGINQAGLYSKSKTATFVLATNPPMPTGLSIEISWSQVTSTVVGSWSNVFVSTAPFYYNVSARLIEEGEDYLVPWQETDDTRLETKIDTSEIPADGADIRYTVRAISYSGLFAATSDDLFVIP